jgi:hypothetical protein
MAEMRSEYHPIHGVTHALRVTDEEMKGLTREFGNWELKFKGEGMDYTMTGFVSQDTVEQDYISKVNLKDMLETRFKKLMEMGESAANRNYYADASRYYGAAGQIKALIRDVDLEEIDQP